MNSKRSLINLNNSIDHTKEPYFFGEGLALQRYDRFKNPRFFELFKKQVGFYWRPEEVFVGGKDRTDFPTLSEQQKFIFTKNLGYQTLLDSVQGRGIHHLTEYLTNPEIEAFCVWWQAFELLHSYSYTYIIKNVYPNPSDIFDNILNDEQIIKRTTSVTEYYDNLIENIPNLPIVTGKHVLDDIRI